MPRPTPTLLVLLLTLAAAIATPAALASRGAPSAHAARITVFRTPSNLIGCMYIGQSFRLERTGRGAHSMHERRRVRPVGARPALRRRPRFRAVRVHVAEDRPG